ncbi:MraY family glycosyltransferase [Mucilaginibacter arboris]|uniref:Undecaprenyl/decaprenyl-phosphate alpha-N-acetylglucosaminyl 1-phosphate transferase n=1 Tax=Mucilaginibacter arboris TaxID=2682090 RepID=A0A7K1STJ7_9SPHI|nr:MraY family glycosyltransferase [Mucilaginibacter arboris]MVN20633.1 undecaprenyl/decaprenyl-phosphate alpha-N-acetylglucosaminyl 1-phosphate transferase [Mucilaginibacter arboris]
MFPFIYYLTVTGVSILLVLIILPSVIHIARQNNLFDDHSVDRKEHGYGIPRLGGVAFYISIVLASLLIAKNGTGLPFYELYAASIILFAIGIKDDLSGVHCHTKLAVQALVSYILTVPGNIRITNLHGIFNVYQLGYLPSVIISMLVIIFIINSFNLIDGIDGLAGTLGVIASCAFGFYFMVAGQTQLAALAFSTGGSLIAFLAYNYSPARIFMGDAGSLFIGMLCAVFAIKFISINEVSTVYNLPAAPAFAAAVLIVPAFDTCSVVITRIYNKKSPFKPDRNHIHHRMLLLGLTHLQTTFILGIVTLLFIGLALVFKQEDNALLLLLFVAILLLMNGLLNHLLSAKSKQVFQVGNLIG